MKESLSSRIKALARRVFLAPTEDGWLGHVRRYVLPILLVVGIWIFASVVEEHYPVRRWLFWRYLSYWMAALAFGLACLSSGHLVVSLILGRRMRLVEHVFLSFVAGVYTFTLTMFLVGILGLYNSVTFFAVPAVLILGGLPSLFKYGRRAFRKLRWARRRAGRPPLKQWVIIAFGCVGLLMLYVLILTPENAQFDARWKHLAIAENFVASGGIRPYQEGWMFSGRPHWFSHSYAWAFLMPRTLLFDRVEAAAHMEFLIFVVTTILGIGAVVRRLVPRAPLATVWAARFLFPGTFLYDSSLSVGADHVGAMYGPAILLMLWRVWQRMSPRAVVLLSIFLAGAAITKETIALMLVPLPVAAVGLRWLWLTGKGLIRRQDKRELLKVAVAPLVAVAACLLLTAPYWLKNFIWHGNPVYPLAASHFGSHPWTAEASYNLKWAYDDYQFSRPPTNWEGIWETLKVLANFSFVPNDWKMFHGDVPVFGSLFTLLLVPLLFFRRTLKIWSIVLWVHVGLFAWYWALHQDRYLQGVAPLMTAVVAALIIRIWRSSRLLARSGLLALLAFQIVWGGDVYFIQTHAMMHTSPIKKVIDLMEGGYKKRFGERLEFGSTGYEELGKAVPRPAKLLLHEFHNHMGVNVPVVMDWTAYQYAIDYDELGSPRAIWKKLEELGVTHVAWHRNKSQGWDSIAGDLAFFEFAMNHTVNQKNVREFIVGEMPPEPPPEQHPNRVLVIACDPQIHTGIFKLSDLDTPVFGPLRLKNPPPVEPLIDTQIVDYARNVHYVVSGDRCKPPFTGGIHGLTLAARRKALHKTGGVPWTLWIRKH